MSKNGENEMCQNLKKILDEFSELNQEIIPEYRPTYLELCQYPGNRFEEICSRIFNFFFNPDAAHGFSDLFLVSLFDCIPESKNVIDHTFETSVLEDVTEQQKRIDISLVLKDEVICIENKIYAPLYNDLNEYKEHIDQTYKGKNKKYFIVLSLKELDENEMDKCQKAGFINIRYQAFFEKINANLGSYIQCCNQRYLAYLLDFMKTVQNKGYFMSDIENFCKSENYQFYCKNERELNKLTPFVEKMRNEISTKQQSQIHILQDFLSYAKVQTADKIRCWNDEGDLPCIIHYKQDSNLGIEFAFGISEKSLCGKIRFIITEWLDWKTNAWENSKGKIMKVYPNGEFRNVTRKKQYFVDFDISIKKGNIENRDELVEELVKMDRLLQG